VLPVHAKSTECGRGTIPVALSEIVVGEFVALLVKDATPDTAPLTCGANRMVTERLAPAAIENGKVTPVTLNPAPVVLAEKTVTLELPVLDKVAVCVTALPTSTLPKERLVG
jgi:hypothetical protein